MTTCPKGHASAATDYCDECGAPIDAAPIPAAPATAPSTVEASAAADPCPECGTVRTDRFCEVCGHDFLAEPRPVAAGGATGVPAGDAPATATPARATPATATPAVSGHPTGNGATLDGSAEAAASAQPGPVTPAPDLTWRVVVSADRTYYERMRAAADPDAPEEAFPAYCPQRRFQLSGAEVLIGRLSRSRGIEPGIDLTGPPEDAAVSHMHALLVATPGGWNIVDLDSANGTYLNDGTEQLAANQPVALSAGDQIHVGGWTTLTITA